MTMYAIGELDRLCSAPSVTAQAPMVWEGPAVSLLYLLNVSNPDRLSSDSGWLFADILAPHLMDRGVRVTVGGPAGLSDPRAKLVRLAAPASKYRARFGFDVAEAADVLRRVAPTVVVANQMEAAPGLRAAMLEAGSDALLAGYCHYVPFYLDPHGGLHLDPSLSDGGLGYSVVLAFFAGLLACDRVMVHSATSRDWISRVGARLSIDLGDRLRIVPPPADPRLVANPADAAPRADGPATGVYNHRLYEHYGTARFIELAESLIGRLPVRVQVMDLFGARRAERTRLDPSPERHLRHLRGLGNVEIVSDGGDRARYRALLAAASFGFAPFRPGCTWSMSVVDCLAMGLPVVSPRLGWLAEITDPDLLFDQPAEAVDIVEHLVTDAGFATAAAARAATKTAEFSPDRVAAAYLDAVTR